MVTPLPGKTSRPSGIEFLLSQTPASGGRAAAPADSFSSTLAQRVARNEPSAPERPMAPRQAEKRPETAQRNQEARSPREPSARQAAERSSGSRDSAGESARSGTAEAERTPTDGRIDAGGNAGAQDGATREAPEGPLTPAPDAAAANPAGAPIILAALDGEAGEAEQDLMSAGSSRGQSRAALAALLAQASGHAASGTGTAAHSDPRAQPAVVTPPAAAAQTAVQTNLATLAASSGAQAAHADLPPGSVLHAGTLVPAARGDQASLPQLTVPTPVGQRAWAEDVGNRLVWMSGRGESRAELVLTPPSLGKLGVSIQVNGDQTTAHFVAASAAARDALEQAMPRLRELLQQAGIQLGQTSVGTSGDQPAGGEAQGERPASSARLAAALGAGDDAPVQSVPINWTRTGSGMIDVFA